MSGTEQVQVRIRRWAEDLVDLSRRNKLLYFTHTRTSSFEFAQSATEVEAGLDRKKGWGFFLPPAPDVDSGEEHSPGVGQPDELVVDMRPRRYGPKIATGLSSLRRTAEAEFLDAGIWVLYLGLGRLEWKDAKDGKPAQSPLLLTPVRLALEGGERRWTLRPSEDGEPALNPALAVKLEKDFGIELPGLDDLGDPTVAEVISTVKDAVSGTDWKVSDAAVLRTFTFHKEVIYRDLMDNAVSISDHPLVEMLALGPSSDAAAELDFEADPEETLDELHPPEDLSCVLDADATQRQCVIAARAGRSFVMDGPPGTGKSQTIANLIAQLLSDGKTVLFVSEKAAALEVVSNRLTDLRLDPFVLGLHSHTATRKAVAQELGAALRERPAARAQFDGARAEQLRRYREELTAYAAAVNETRQPLGLSLHSAIGRISELANLLDAPVPALATAGTTSESLAALRKTAGILSGAWGPVSRGADFLWRDLKDPGGGLGRQANLRRLTQALDGAVADLRDSANAVADELRLPPPRGPVEADQLRHVLALVAQRVPVGPSWLAAEDAETESRMAKLEDTLINRDEVHRWLADASSGWQMSDPAASEAISAAAEELDALRPQLPALDRQPVVELEAVAATLDHAAETFEALVPWSQILTEAFGVPEAASVQKIRRLAALGQLAGVRDAPEPEWLDPAVKYALEEAKRVLTDLLQHYRTRREALRTIFTEDALKLDLRALQTRFTTVHTGAGRLTGAYRQDKRSLAAVTVTGKVNKAVLSKLDDAIEWKDSAERLAQAEARNAGVLGARYYPSGAEADVEEIERAVDLATQALELAGGEVSPQRLGQQLGRGGSPDPRLHRAATTTASAFETLWQGQFAGVVGERLAEIERMSLQQAGQWAAAAAKAVRRLFVAHRSPASALGPDVVTVQQSNHFAQQRSRVERLGSEVQDLVRASQDDLGSLSEDLSVSRLQQARDWVRTVKAQFDGQVRKSTASALLASSLGQDELDGVCGAYLKAVEALLSEFGDAYASELRDELNDSFGAAIELVAALERSVADVDEWEAFVRARGELAEAGYEPVLAAMEAGRVREEEVGGIIERTFLTRWVDEIVNSDDRLQVRRATDRDQLARDFRYLDRALVESAAARVINACAPRRPRSLVGGAGIIKQQAELKGRHKPIRQLLDEAADAALAVKPCFMMSPLSVSQFLPSDLRFDVVIFDEASQVREEDAIGCIYRGSQLIVAGDPKQLPPTDFFAKAADTDGEDSPAEDEVLDFDSVLDRCKAQGLPALPLSWHYRSRHESLITFSNRSFYDGRLHTFPGATFDSPDLGVELFHVEGEYRRGTTRDNPLEASKVVDRVVFHRRAHPDLTLGVVALSSAQQDAIEAEVERRSASEPELRELVTDDRLDGFFVKNLENVQGDERDLIILSIGYGPDENGKLTMNFGPMNKSGGERRLNVAVTRARRRVEVVSSVRAGDINSETTAVRHLKRYLSFAERGPAALAIDMNESLGDAESPFEEEVIRSVTALGYEPVPQVGVAGFRVDVGVKHPTTPGNYVLGVECDGYTYHSSKVARDRDRLRQQVLEGLGWTIHRIWSTAWFSDRPGEEERLRQAIEAAVHGEHKDSLKTEEFENKVRVEVDEFDFSQRPEWVYVYEAPALAFVPAPPDDFTEARSRAPIVHQIQEVIRDYGPLHRDVLLETVRTAWRIGRSGARIKQAFNEALASAVAGGSVVVEGDFVSVPGEPILVRVPENDSETLRPVAHVPPTELDLAVEGLLRDAGESPVENLRTAWARLFGWRRVGSEIQIAFETSVDRLRRNGTIEGSDPIRLVQEHTSLP